MTLGRIAGDGLAVRHLLLAFFGLVAGPLWFVTAEAGWERLAAFAATAFGALNAVLLARRLRGGQRVDP